jgi:hypothetical protein
MGLYSADLYEIDSGNFFVGFAVDDKLEDLQFPGSEHSLEGRDRLVNGLGDWGRYRLPGY